MLQPAIPGWRAETLGDDIAWMRCKDVLYAVNPGIRLLRAAPGTQLEVEDLTPCAPLPPAARCSPIALTDDGDVWWGGPGKATRST